MTATLEKIDTLHDFVLRLLTDPVFGLDKACLTSEETSYVQRAIELLKQTRDKVPYDAWTELKIATFKSVGSPVADAISRMCSAFRNPKQAGISGMRDSIEKIIQAHTIATERRVQAEIHALIRSLPD